MRSRTVLLLSLILVAPAFTGCLGIGGDEDASGDTGLNSNSSARVSSSTGGIEGVVTDSAVQAVDGVEVTIEELGASTTTTTDGSFAFSEITPGTYTLNFTKEGFIAAERSVDVVAQEISTLELVLAHKPEVQPFMQSFKYEGFLECSVSGGAPGVGFVRAAACSFPNVATQEVGGGNATNDRFIFFSPAEPNPWQIVTEMQWDPGTPAASVLALSVEPGGLSNAPNAEYGSSEAESPIIIQTDRTRIANVVENTTRVCNGEQDPDPSAVNPPPPESYCNRNIVEKGGTIQMRVFVGNYEGFTGVTFQQPFTIFQTVFYNAPACEDYSIINENRCPQMEEPPEVDPYEEIVGGNASSGNNTSG